jgi:hypothetical protein
MMRGEMADQAQMAVLIAVCTELDGSPEKVSVTDGRL